MVSELAFTEAIKICQGGEEAMVCFRWAYVNHKSLQIAGVQSAREKSPKVSDYKAKESRPKEFTAEEFTIIL